jgi:crotonobetainyl-CoA:carnitine CoA-transferase CaiB-like acyl-CoA transferase
LRVIDVSRVLAGPFCSQLLGDMGAHVIEIEDVAAKNRADRL